MARKNRETIPYICMYDDYLEALEPLTDGEKGRLLTAMLLYARTGQVQKLSGNERFLWPILKSKIDMDRAAYQEKCEKNRLNGKKGGRPSENPTVILQTQQETQEPKKPNQNHNQNQNQNHNQNQSQNQTSPAQAAGRGPLFLPPTVEEVSAFCTQQGFSIDPGRFVDYYTANGWQMGSASMKDWKAALKCWNGKEKPNGKTQAVPTWHVGTEL